MIQCAVRELVISVIRHHKIIWGGHQAITPMIWSICDDLNVKYAENVILYQSLHFKDRFPEENERFGNVIFTDDIPERDCLLYSGFSRFHQMSSPNMRYFQELCKVTFTLFEENRGTAEELLNTGVPPDIQARAAKLASTELFEDVAKGGQLNSKAFGSRAFRHYANMPDSRPCLRCIY